MSNTTLCGYTGLFKQPVPKSNNNYLTNTFFATNIQQDTLVIVALTPAAFKDLNLLAGLQQFKNVIILTTAVDALFISDIFNTVMLNLPIKPTIKWVYPRKPDIKTSVEFELSQIVANDYILYGDGNNEVFDIKFEYILSNMEDRTYYDIKVTDGKTTKYLCAYTDEKKMNILYDDITIDEIHLAFSSTLYGGLSFLDLNARNNKYITKMVANSFVNMEEYTYSITRGFKMGKVRINDLI